MEKKFTPGPWEITEYSGFEDKTCFMGEIVAQNGTKVYAGPMSFSSLKGKNRKESDANARLISHAPDLFDAVQAVVSITGFKSLNPKVHRQLESLLTRITTAERQ